MRIARSVARLAALSLVVGACAQEDSPLAPPPVAAFNHVGGSATVAHLTVCKEGPAATFDISLDDTSPTNNDVFLDDVAIGDGECETVYAVTLVEGERSSVTYSVTENVPAQTSLVKVVKDEHYMSGSVVTTQYPGTNNPTTGVITDDKGDVVTFYNEPVGSGRMTGGGNPKVDGVNLGLTLHCDITLSNNLEINWEGGNWHLTKPITSAVCVDDPAIDQKPPKAPFDTFIGTAFGSLNGVDGSFVTFRFADAGEPGRNDTVAIEIWAPGADPSTDSPVLEIAGNLTHGNLQAHEDQPHK